MTWEDILEPHPRRDHNGKPTVDEYKTSTLRDEILEEIRRHPLAQRRIDSVVTPSEISPYQPRDERGGLQLVVSQTEGFEEIARRGMTVCQAHQYVQNTFDDDWAPGDYELGVDPRDISSRLRDYAVVGEAKRRFFNLGRTSPRAVLGVARMPSQARVEDLYAGRVFIVKSPNEMRNVTAQELGLSNETKTYAKDCIFSEVDFGNSGKLVAENTLIGDISPTKKGSRVGDRELVVAKGTTIKNNKASYGVIIKANDHTFDFQYNP